MKPPKSRKAELAANASGGEKSNAETSEAAEFKMTELGSIPVDWEVKRIDQCGDVVTGSTPPRGVSELWGGSFNWISAKDFKGKFIVSSEEKVTEAGKRYCRTLPANSVLVTCIASIGLNAIAKRPCATNQQINAVICRDCDYEYFYYQCCFNESRLRQMAGQTAVPIIGKSQFEEFTIALPKEIKEQRRIARALSDVDELISALGKLIEKKRNIKTGSMQQLLTGKTRLPGFGAKHAEFKQTELGPIPVDWEVKRLGDVSTLYNGYAFKSSSYVENGKYTVITIANVQDGSFSSDTANGINYLPRDIQRHQILKEGDILISMTGNVGRTCHVSRKNCLLNQRVGKFDSIKIDMSFLYIVVQDKNFISAMVDKGQGGAQANISKHDIEEYLFPLPTLAEQKAIAAVLSDMDAEIAALEADRAKYKRIKSGMMQELLTGKTRLKP